MSDERSPSGRATGESNLTPRTPLRARTFKDIVASLAKVASVRGVLLVTPDGLVITASPPARWATEALAALGAALGRELELGAGRLGRGRFETALFVTDQGSLFVGASRLGFVILVADEKAQAATIEAALAGALDRL